MSLKFLLLNRKNNNNKRIIMQINYIRFIFITYYFKFNHFVICQNQNDNRPIKSDDTSITLPVESSSYCNPTSLNRQQEKTKTNVVDEELIVHVKNGAVRGKAVYLDNDLPANSTKLKKRVNAWLGIPYAEKPMVVLFILVLQL